MTLRVLSEGSGPVGPPFEAKLDQEFGSSEALLAPLFLSGNNDESRSLSVHVGESSA
jgi:hypothetical protein